MPKSEGGEGSQYTAMWSSNGEGWRADSRVDGIELRFAGEREVLQMSRILQECIYSHSSACGRIEAIQLYECESIQSQTIRSVGSDCLVGFDPLFVQSYTFLYRCIR